MMKTGLIGWRGMVGSVLMARMRAEGDFDVIEPYFFSTSQAGQPGPDPGSGAKPLLDASDIRQLAAMDVIISCQGGDYTKSIHPQLRAAGWKGYWIDAASALRMDDRATIILDPVNRAVIDQALARGDRDFIGGNCTVSLMLMAIGGLFQRGLVEWVSSMTYQAASGAGAQNMKELLAQMGALHQAVEQQLADPASDIIEVDRRVTAAMRSDDFPIAQFGYPLAGNLLPWIDTEVAQGQSREELKGHIEANKILGLQGRGVPVDGLCVRVGSMRCHAQALTIKLRKDLPLEEIEQIIAGANDWVRVVPNTKADTLQRLSPAAVAGELSVPIGRLRKMRFGPEYLSAFTLGDQLLWGAAEPLRRMLRILQES